MPRKPSTSMAVRYTADGSGVVATREAVTEVEAPSPRSDASTDAVPWKAGRIRSAAAARRGMRFDPIGDQSEQRRIRHRVSPVCGHALQDDLIGRSAVVDKVRRARSVLLQVHEGSDLECVRGHRERRLPARTGRLCTTTVPSACRTPQRVAAVARAARGGGAPSRPTAMAVSTSDRDADVPVRDAQREDDREHDVAGATDATGRPSRLTCRMVGAPARRSRSPPRTLPEVDAPE